MSASNVSITFDQTMTQADLDAINAIANFKATTQYRVNVANANQDVNVVSLNYDANGASGAGVCTLGG